MSEPKRQHYVPRFYLAGFCRDGQSLWIRDGVKKLTRSDKPENTAAINHYYSLEKDGKRDNIIEKGFSQMEGLAMSLIGALVEGKQLDQEGRDNLSLYVAVQWMRVPDFQRGVEKIAEHFLRLQMRMMFRDEEDVKKSLDEFAKETGQTVGVEPAKLLELFQKDGLKVDIKRSLSLEMMLKQAEPMANHFRLMNWVILHAEGNCSFVTSDNPFVLVPPGNFPRNTWRGVGITTPGSRKLLTLTQSCCLMMLDPGTAMVHHRVSRTDLRNINRNIALHVTRFLFGRDEALINNLAPLADEAAEKRDGSLTIN